MATIEIHGKKVTIPDDSHSAKYAADFLTKYPDDAKAFFEKAHHDHINGVAHFQIPHNPNHPVVSHHFTLIHNSDGTYNLRKQTGH